MRFVLIQYFYKTPQVKTQVVLFRVCELQRAAGGVSDFARRQLEKFGWKE
jgi:hypothetical protein